jgi:hypothetical protein
VKIRKKSVIIDTVKCDHNPRRGFLRMAVQHELLCVNPSNKHVSLFRRPVCFSRLGIPRLLVNRLLRLDDMLCPQTAVRRRQ